MRCSVCHQDYKQSDIIDNYFVKDTTEATSTSDEKAAQVCESNWSCGNNTLFSNKTKLKVFFQIQSTVVVLRYTPALNK